MGEKNGEKKTKQNNTHDFSEPNRVMWKAAFADKPAVWF